MGENQRKPTPALGRKKRPDKVGAVDVTGIEKDGPGEAQFLIEREPDFWFNCRNRGPPMRSPVFGSRGLISAYLNPRMCRYRQVEQFVGRHAPMQLVHPPARACDTAMISHLRENTNRTRRYSAQRQYHHQAGYFRGEAVVRTLGGGNRESGNPPDHEGGGAGIMDVGGLLQHRRGVGLHVIEMDVLKPIRPEKAGVLPFQGVTQAHHAALADPGVFAVLPLPVKGVEAESKGPVEE